MGRFSGQRPMWEDPVLAVDNRLLAEVLEELLRAARHHVAEPNNQVQRDRLTAAMAEADRVLYVLESKGQA